MPQDHESRDGRHDLHRKAAELDALFDMLPIGIGIASDPECRHIRVNRTFARQLGIDYLQNASLTAPPGERPAFRVLKNGRDVDPNDLPMQYAARHGVEVRDVELEVVHPDGRRVVLYEYAAPLYDDHGRVRGALGAFMDITERRQIEEEQRFLADASRVLSSSLDYHTTLRALAQLCVPHLGDYCAVDVLREDGAFERVELVVNDPARQAIGDALRRFPPVLSVDSPATRAIRAGEPAMLNDLPLEVIERSAQSADHLRLLQEFDVRTSMLVPIRARGRTLGLLSVGRFSADRPYRERDMNFAADIGMRAGLALDNALLYGRAQEANRLKDDFLATLSHELRTPLNALLGWAQILKTRPLDEGGRRRAIESIERNAQAQTVLINDLLDVSRVISGKLRLESMSVDLQSVVLAAIDAVKPAVRAREIDLGVSITPLTGEVIGDADRLQQVVWNLLSNAVKFTPSGGRVEIGLEEVGAAVQITVSDTGVGVDPAFLPHMFERFRQGDSSSTRAHGGLGLGLAIVRHLVDLHGGTVTAASEGAGAGARFTVTLPMRKKSLAPSTDRAGARVHAASAVLRGVRVLAVDDDADSRELMLLNLQTAGAEVLAVGSGIAALDALESFRPHVIIADIAMPGIDGYELMRQVTARTGDGPRGIALSAYVSSEDAQRAHDAGFAVHFGKPADYETLVRTIAELVGTASTFTECSPGSG